MNHSTVQGNWTELKGKIKTQWGKLTDDDLKAVEGNIEQLSGRIQKAYGYAKDKAEKEYNDFKAKNLSSAKSTTDAKVGAQPSEPPKKFSF